MKIKKKLPPNPLVSNYFIREHCSFAYAAYSNVQLEKVRMEVAYEIHRNNRAELAKNIAEKANKEHIREAQMRSENAKKQSTKF